MNNGSGKKGYWRPHMPAWLREECVWQGLLVILVMPAVVHAILSLGVGVA